MLDGRTGGSAPRALWYAGAGRADLRPVQVPPPGDGQAVVTTLWSGISRGTERLVFEGRVPPSEYDRMRCPLQDGDFPFPVKYGYAAVGRVEHGPADLAGRLVFALHPHQERFSAPVDMLLPVPDGVPARRATLAANMETALNALWDSGAHPADRIVVVGAGLVGCLVAAIAARLPGAGVTLVDIDPARAAIAAALGCAFAQPGRAPQEADVVFHTSASGAGLSTALRAAGFEATVVELSWYGLAEVEAPLGDTFHSKRLKLISSQVGQVATSRRARWTHRRRLAAALDLLADDRLDALVTGEVAFGDLPAALPALLAADAPGLATAVRYGATT